METTNYEGMPMISIKNVGVDGKEEYALATISGDKNLFMRLGEFLAMMHGDKSFYLNIIHENEALSNSVIVDLHPFDDPDDEEVTTYSEAVMGEVTVDSDKI